MAKRPLPLLPIPPLKHTLEFLEDFSLHFLLPLLATVCAILFVAALLLRLYKIIVGRYATPEELFDEALALLKRDGDIKINSDNHQRALDNLRLVIQINPVMMKGYTLLAKELLYREVNKEDESIEGRHNNINSIQNASTNNSLRRRQGIMQQIDNTTPNLVECKEIIRKGLSLEPTNESLLKLQSELNLVIKYGRNNAQTKMMNVGSFGWS